MTTIYVSNSGNDLNDGLSETTPKKTIISALKLIKNNSSDWLLLRRGDTWDIANEGGAGRGVWRWDWHGISDVERCGIGAYGSSDLPRPILENGGFWYGAKVRPLKHFTCTDIEFYWSSNDPSSEKYQQTSADHRGFFVGVELEAALDSKDIVVKNCMFRYCTVGAMISCQTSGSKMTDVRIYDNEFIECKNFGLMIDRQTNCLVHSNRFVECGWKDRTVQLHAMYTTDCDNITITNNLFYLPGNFGLKFSGNGKNQCTNFVIENNVFYGGGLGLGHARLDGSWNPLVDFSHSKGLVSNNIFSMTCKDFPAGSNQFQSIGCNIGNLNEVLFVDNLFIHNKPESGGEIFRFTDPTLEKSSNIRLVKNKVWNWESRARRQQGSYISYLPADTVQEDNLAENYLFLDPLRSFEKFAETNGLTTKRLAESDIPAYEIIKWISQGFSVIAVVDAPPIPTPNPTPVPEPEPKSEIIQLTEAIKYLADIIKNK